MALTLRLSSEYSGRTVSWYCYCISSWTEHMQLVSLVSLSGFVSGRYQLHTLITDTLCSQLSAGVAKDNNSTAPNEAYDGVHNLCQQIIIVPTM